MRTDHCGGCHQMSVPGRGLWCYFLSGPMFFQRLGVYDVTSCLAPCAFQGGQPGGFLAVGKKIATPESLQQITVAKYSTNKLRINLSNELDRICKVF